MQSRKRRQLCGGGRRKALPVENSSEYSRRVALAEVEVVATVADLVGYDPAQAGGVFTFGGTGTSMYGVKIGLGHKLYQL